LAVILGVYYIEDERKIKSKMDERSSGCDGRERSGRPVDGKRRMDTGDRKSTVTPVHMPTYMKNGIISPL
jgi:hypothetical protein